MGGGREQKLGTAKVTFRFFLGEETGLDFGGGRGVRESEKMAKKRDLLSLQAKNILTQDYEGASLGCMVDNRKHQQGTYEPASPSPLGSIISCKGT